MTVDNIDIDATIKKVQELLAQEPNLSPALRSTLDILLLVVQLLANRLGLNSRNSSKPPSTDFVKGEKKTKDGNNKAGGQVGRIGTTLSKVADPDEIKLLKVDRASLPPAQYRDIGFESRQVFDIDIQRIVTEYRAQILEDEKGNIDLLKKLVDYTIRTDFPHLGAPSPAIYIDWFTEVCKKTAKMIVHWQRVGFVHGVMNTDNMSILGLTIDYGPYGWLENFDPNWTPNTSDSQEHYRFGNQPQIAFWNLGQLANSIYPLIEQTEPFHKALSVYTETFEQGWHKMMANKLGFKKFDPETDEELCSDLFVLLQLIETDMSIFYRQLAKLNCSSLLPLTENDFNAALLLLSLSYYIPKQITPSYKTRLYEWLNRYCNRVQKDKNTNLDRQKQMNTVNPKYVLRNYLAQLAIDQAEQGNFVMVNELLELLRKPYDEQPDKEKLAAKRPDWQDSDPVAQCYRVPPDYLNWMFEWLV